MSNFKIIAGLGNPGRRYEETRHNAGFLLLDALVSRIEKGDLPDFSRGSSAAFSWQERSGALMGVVSACGERLLLVKPQTFMNRSGESLQQIMSYYKLEPAQLAVVHDDIDLPLGTIRIKTGGGDGGHNGLKSIAQCLSSRDFARVRLGIGRPLPKSTGPAGPGESGEEQAAGGYEMEITDWVLGRFGGEDRETVDRMLSLGVDALAEVCRSGVRAAQTKFN